MIKYRIKYSRDGRIKYYSHLDIIEALRKTVLRAGINVEYSGGFSPSMKISFSAPLPVGYEGCAEILDMGVSSNIDPGFLLEKLNAVSLRGLEFFSAYKVPPSGFSLTGEINYVEYAVDTGGKLPPEKIRENIKAFTSAAAFEVEKKDKKIDAKRYIDKIGIEDSFQFPLKKGGQGVVIDESRGLFIKMGARIINQATVKPDLVLAKILNYPDAAYDFRFVRLRFLIERQKEVFYDP